MQPRLREDTNAICWIPIVDEEQKFILEYCTQFDTNYN